MGKHTHLWVSWSQQAAIIYVGWSNQGKTIIHYHHFTMDVNLYKKRMAQNTLTNNTNMVKSVHLKTIINDGRCC